MASSKIIVSAGVVLLLALGLSPVAASADEYSPAAQVAIAHLSEQYERSDLDAVAVTDEYTSPHNGVTHVYLRQRHEGIEVLGADATVNVKDGAVVYSGSRLVHDIEANASGSEQIPPADALAAAAAAVDATAQAPKDAPVLVYQKLDDGTVRLAYNVEIVLEHHWWNLSVDAETAKVIHKEDFVDHEDIAHVAASTARTKDAPAVRAALNPMDPILPPEQVQDGSDYKVFALPMESPLDGERSVVENPADAVSSPFGWHDTDGQPGPEHATTRGNNVNAYHDTVADNSADPFSQPDGGSELTFDHPIPTYDATPAVYRDAAVTNLFYWNNVMHDVTSRYGFNEPAGNFQQTNYSGAGKGGDAVLAEAQDGSFVLNANFSTPPDGEPGRMQMFLWVDAFRALTGDAQRVPSHQVRDGDLESGVIAHEYGHGVSNRLVGGPDNVSCLRKHDERQGEGWSDWWSYALTMRAGDDGATPRGIGNYVIYHDEGRTGPGIRITPYSTDMSINPSTYNTIRRAAEPHGVGYVWATMLWDMYWNLVEVHGFNPNPYESWETGGNNLAMQLVVDGMKFAPCEPGFTDARDAIIAADAALTGDAAAGIPGQNECLIWSTFARRGLGVSAQQNNPASKTDGIEAFDVPAHCSTG